MVSKKTSRGQTVIVMKLWVQPNVSVCMEGKLYKNIEWHISQKKNSPNRIS